MLFVNWQTSLWTHLIENKNSDFLFNVSTASSIASNESLFEALKSEIQIWNCNKLFVCECVCARARTLSLIRISKYHIKLLLWQTLIWLKTFRVANMKSRNEYCFTWLGCRFACICMCRNLSSCHVSNKRHNAQFHVIYFNRWDCKMIA